MKQFLLYFFLLTSLAICAQNKFNAIFIDSVAVNAAKYLGKDNFDHVYFEKNNQIHKKNNDKEFYYKNLSLGSLSQISFENSLQPLLLYADFNTVVILDNQLSEVQKIDFNTVNPFLKVSCIGFGGQNKIWFFDAITQKFGLYNTINASVTFISNSQNTQITKTHSDYNYFYYTDQNNKYYKISIFGKITLLGKLPMGASFCFVNESEIIYQLENALFILDFKSQTSSELLIPEKSFTNFFFKDGILSIFTPNKIINYQINLP